MSFKTQSRLWRMDRLQTTAATLLGVAAVFMVWRVAWVTEDSFITFRYVANTLAGHGAVFSVGEYSQGYTHPLWFALLLVGGSFVPDLILLSCGLGLLLTFAAQFFMGRSLMLGGNVLPGGVAAALFALVCVSRPGSRFRPAVSRTRCRIYCSSSWSASSSCTRSSAPSRSA
jgi:hypothetical protein